MNNQNGIYRSFVLLAFGILFVNYIIKLNSHSIYIWDESIYANNSLEMSVTKNFSYYTNDGIKNYFNVKPPLVIILQSLSLTLFGYSELALRLPTLLFLLGIIFLLVYYSNKLFKNFVLGIEASVFLLLCVGAIRPHVFLSADLDAGLVFFSLLLLLNHLEVCESKQLTTRNWILYFIAIIFGWLCKSTAIFLVVPALFVVSICYKNVRLILRDVRTYFTLLTISLIISSFYFYKFKTDPYYVQLVWETEYMRLVKNIMPWHEQPFSFYFLNTVKQFATFHWIVLCITFLVGISRQKLSRIHYALLLAIGVYLLTISIPRVKLEWYDAFIYPVLCLLISANINKIIGLKSAWYKVLISIPLYLVLLMFFNHKSKLFYSNLQSQELEGEFLKSTDAKFPSLKILMKVEDDKVEHYNAVKFYLKRNKLTDEKFKQILIPGVKDIIAFDTVLCCNKSQIDSLQTLFKTTPIYTRGNCIVYKIIK